MKYKFLEHTADVKFQSYGKTIEEAFENAAYALKEVMFGKIKIKEKVKRTIKVEGKDNESLLQSFLEQFLYLLDAENFVFNKVKVKIKDNKLEAEVWGDLASSYRFSNDVKAVTYNQMFVRQISCRKFACQVVLDV